MTIIEQIQSRIANKFCGASMDSGGWLAALREYEDAVERNRAAPQCICCGGRQEDDMAALRAHALALRDEGATHVSVGAMSVVFGPKPQPPLTAESVATALAAQGPPEPVGDERYVP